MLYEVITPRGAAIAAGDRLDHGGLLRRRAACNITGEIDAAHGRDRNDGRHRGFRVCLYVSARTNFNTVHAIDALAVRYDVHTVQWNAHRTVDHLGEALPVGDRLEKA